MNRLILALFLICSTGVISQENFKAENNSIIWQKVYKTELSQEKISELLKREPVLNPIAESFSGTVDPVDVECEKRQPIFMRGNIQFFANIDFKEGRYRVTVSKIQIIPTTTTKLFGSETTTEPESYEDYQLKSRNGEFRSNRMAQNSLHCLDHYFQELFTFTSETSNDW